MPGARAQIPMKDFAFPGLNEQCDVERLRQALARLDQPGIRADSAIYAQMLRQCASVKALPEGRCAHEHIVKAGYGGDVLLQNLLVQMYGKCGCLDEAFEVFDRIVQRNRFSWNIMIAAYAQNGYLRDAKCLFDKTPQKDAVTWNIMITAFARNGYGLEALVLLKRMDLEGATPDKFTFLSTVEACAALELLAEGKAIHRHIIDSGLQTDVVVGTALVSMYGKCRSLDDAKVAFDRIPHKNSVTWNAMVAVYAQNGHLEDAIRLFETMPRRDVISWTAMITAYAQKGNVQEAKKMFDRMPKRNVVSWNAMIAAYAQNGYMQEARMMFDRMPQKNAASWNSMISAYSWDKQAIELFCRMDLEGRQPNMITFISTLDACACSVGLMVGKIIHEHLVKNGFLLDVVAETSLVNMYGKCGSLCEARDIFNNMCLRNVVSWNAMIAAYAQHGHGKDALKLFELMNLDGTNADEITFVSVLAACSHVGKLEDGWDYFLAMVQSYGIVPTCEHYVCMIDLLGRAGQLAEAEELINNMPFEPSNVAWTILLGACRVNRDVKRGKRIAEEVNSDVDSAPYVLVSNMVECGL